jgi:hypothetical protein
MSLDLNAACFSDLHLHINVNLTSFLHYIFGLDKNDWEKLCNGSRGDWFEELAKVSSTRLFLNEDTNCHAVVEEKLHGERQREVEFQGLFWDLWDAVRNLHLYPMFILQMFSEPVESSVFPFQTACLRASVSKDPKVAMIMLFFPILTN